MAKIYISLARPSVPICDAPPLTPKQKYFFHFWEIKTNQYKSMLLPSHLNRKISFTFGKSRLFEECRKSNRGEKKPVILFLEKQKSLFKEVISRITKTLAL